MLRKLKNSKAETLLETLISILIAVLSITLLSTAVMASARINTATRAADKTFAEKVAEAELGSVLNLEDQTITVRFSDGSYKNVTVDIYGSGQYASYKKGETP